MIQFTELERAVLAKLLAGEHPLLNQLRSQLRSCRIVRREMTGHGFYTHFSVGDAPAPLDVKVSFGDVVAEIDGMPDGAGFELYVEHGQLSMLEGYGYDDPWPRSVTGFALRYATGDERDWPAIKEVIGGCGDAI